MAEAVENILVEKLVAEATVEALDEAALLQLAGGNVVPRNAGLTLPFEDRLAGQFGLVVADGGRWLAV